MRYRNIKFGGEHGGREEIAPQDKMSRRAKNVKWTEQMNKDILECKRKAQDLVVSNDAPRNRNGRKKGYIEVMAELWGAKGYAHLGIKSQNLRDQASRLEKIGLDTDADESISNIAVNNDISSETFDENSANSQQSQNANETLHRFAYNSTAIP